MILEHTTLAHHGFPLCRLNKAFIDIRLRPSIATPLVVVGQRFSLPRIAIRPITAKRDVTHKTGST